MTRAALAERVGDRLRELGARRTAVAVSGGLDSTALLRLSVEAGCDVVAVHVDHGLRPDSNDAAAFVGELARALGVTSRVVRASPAAGNVQAEARSVRYAALETVARELACDAVATAHTADDQAETLLLALVRGAGLRGLAAMPPARPVSRGSDLALLRPLLGTERAELAAVAEAEGWVWREDASNAGEAYRRNRFRHTVLPALRAEGGPGTARRIAAAAAAARAALDDVGPARRLRDLGTADARGGWLPTAALAALAAPARRALWAEALAAWTDGPRSAPVVASVDALLDAEAGRRVGLGRWTAWRDRDRIRLVADAPRSRVETVAGPPPWTLVTPLGTLTAALETESALPGGEGSASVRSAGPGRGPGGEPGVRGTVSEAVHADALASGAELRPWRAGDRMRPLGLGGSRLVSDVLQDRRVPPSEKARQLVLVAGGDVLWLVGHRLAEAAAAQAGAPTVQLVWRPVAGAPHP